MVQTDVCLRRLVLKAKLRPCILVRPRCLVVKLCYSGGSAKRFQALGSGLDLLDRPAFGSFKSGFNQTDNLTKCNSDWHRTTTGQSNTSSRGHHKSPILRHLPISARISAVAKALACCRPRALFSSRSHLRIPIMSPCLTME